MLWCVVPPVKAEEWLGLGHKPQKRQESCPVLQVFLEENLLRRADSPSHQPKLFGLSYHVELGPQPQEGKGRHMVVY